MASAAPLQLVLANHGLDFSLLLQPRLTERYASTLKTQMIDWGSLWSALRTSMMNQKQMDVVEIGSTWFGSLTGRNALLRLDDVMGNDVGGSEVFTASAWASVQQQGQVFALPWLSDVRVIVYWRDMLQDAGLDDPFTLEAPEHLESVLEKLQAHGIASPWGVPTERHTSSVQGMASWLWHYGSDFIDPETGRMGLTTAPALQAAEAYFRLGRFLPRSNDSLTENQIVNFFASRRVAMVLGAAFMLPMMKRTLPPELYERIGVMLPPGPPFVGGSHLAIISHINPELLPMALDLLKWLVSGEVQDNVIRAMGLLPVRQDSYPERFMQENEHHHIYLYGLQTGRTLPIIKAWGSIEERLLQVYAQVWARLRAAPKRSLHDLLTEELSLLEGRLNPMLKSGQSSTA